MLYLQMYKTVLSHTHNNSKLSDSPKHLLKFICPVSFFLYQFKWVFTFYFTWKVIIVINTLRNPPSGK